MAAALRTAEGGGYIFPKSSGGYIQNFSGQGVYPLPPIPDPCITRTPVSYNSKEIKTTTFVPILKTSIECISRFENLKLLEIEFCPMRTTETICCYTFFEELYMINFN